VAAELTAGAWVILQEQVSGGWEGPTVIYVLPGARVRLFNGRFTPFGAVHVGVTVNRAAYVANGLNAAGAGFDATAGVEWVPFGWFDVEVFATYYLTSAAPIPRNANRLGVASFFVVGASLGIAIPVR
jgi:hypothetical protein